MKMKKIEKFVKKKPKRPFFTKKKKATKKLVE